MRMEEIVKNDARLHELHLVPPSPGCSPPTPTVNGNVSGLTSSKVGAQVTYHCDTDLVLVGDRVATCSQPSPQ